MSLPPLVEPHHRGGELLMHVNGNEGTAVVGCGIGGRTYVQGTIFLSLRLQFFHEPVGPRVNGGEHHIIFMRYVPYVPVHGYKGSIFLLYFSEAFDILCHGGISADIHKVNVPHTQFFHGIFRAGRNIVRFHIEKGGIDHRGKHRTLGGIHEIICLLFLQSAFPRIFKGITHCGI